MLLIIYKLSFSKTISKLFVIKLILYLNFVFSQFAKNFKKNLARCTKSNDVFIMYAKTMMLFYHVCDT